ncbi:hypothetical protein, partial [Xylella fastidiosa]|uniref:hypothetical protein n=1 Tax=Xylella fastidiosa TaxID=2371 RepID=UPI0014120E83
MATFIVGHCCDGCCLFHTADVDAVGDTFRCAGLVVVLDVCAIFQGVWKESDLYRARQLQAESGVELLPLLGRLGLVSERDH